MVKTLWALVIAAFLAFIFMALEIGVGPRPIKVIKPSLAKEPSEIGFWIYRQLRHVVFKHDVIFWGYQNERIGAEMLKGFWEYAKNDSQEITNLIRLKGASAQLPIPTHDLPVAEDLLKVLPQVRHNSKKTIVFLPSTHASHVVRDSLVMKTEVQENLKIMSVNALDWQPEHPGEKMVQEHCEEAKNLTGFPDFEFFRCIYKSRRSKLEKLKEPSKIVFLVDQYGASDYLVLVYP